MSDMPDMTDDDFVAAFFSGRIPPTSFHHRDHLRLTWCLVRKEGVETASAMISSGIRHFATQHGQAAKYHETMTQFWVRIVSHVIDARPEIATFDQFLETHPQLLDKTLPYHHWSRETMQSQAARAEWVEPDLLALPA
jgi:CDP-diacylglycerol--glycerol-3-phosphate 3-phosphatidyltransferase